jgi:hypothetical protein
VRPDRGRGVRPDRGCGVRLRRRRQVDPVAGVVPEREAEAGHQQREDDPGLAQLGRGELERPRQQVELVHAERPEDGAAAVRQLVAGDVRRAAERDHHREHRDVPVPDRQPGQVGAGQAGDDRRRDAEQVAVVPADVQRAQGGRVEQREEQHGGHQVPGERGVRETGLPGAGQLVRAGRERARGEHRDAEQAVGAMPVSARQLRHQPGEPLGEEPERAGDRGVLMVDVRQHARPRAEHDSRRQVRVGHVQDRGEPGEGERAAQRVIPAHHGAVCSPAGR